MGGFFGVTPLVRGMTAGANLLRDLQRARLEEEEFAWRKQQAERQAEQKDLEWEMSVRAQGGKPVVNGMVAEHPGTTAPMEQLFGPNLAQALIPSYKIPEAGQTVKATRYGGEKEQWWIPSEEQQAEKVGKRVRSLEEFKSQLRRGEERVRTAGDVEQEVARQLLLRGTQEESDKRLAKTPVGAPVQGVDPETGGTVLVYTYRDGTQEVVKVPGMKPTSSQPTPPMSEAAYNQRKNIAAAGRSTSAGSVALTQSRGLMPTGQGPFTVADTPDQFRGRVERILNYLGPLPPASRLNPENMAIREWVSRIDPSYDERKYLSRAAFMKDATTGMGRRKLEASNTLVAHLGTLNKLTTALKNRDMRAVNAGVNWVRDQIGDPRIVNAETAINAVANEAENAFRSTGTGTITGIEEFKRNLNVIRQSPAQSSGQLKAMVELLAGRVREMGNSEIRAMGRSEIMRLSPNAEQTLIDMGIDPTAFRAEDPSETKPKAPQSGGGFRVRSSSGVTGTFTGTREEAKAKGYTILE